MSTYATPRNSASAANIFATRVVTTAGLLSRKLRKYASVPTTKSSHVRPTTADLT